MQYYSARRVRGLPRPWSPSWQKPRGLILVTGSTGSGKSTTLASMLDRINQRRRGHIVTIGIRMVSASTPWLLGQPTRNWSGTVPRLNARSMRGFCGRPRNMALVGEMRDLETVEAALTIAETGHLCLASLHTNNAIQSINRIIDVFRHQQSQVRAVLSFALEGVVSPSVVTAGQWLWPGVGVGSVGAQRGGAQSHSRRQTPPDLFANADRPNQIRHANAQSVAARSIFEKEY